MKRVVFAIFAALLIFSCGEEPLPEPGNGNGTDTPTPSGKTWSVNGSVQKGPFTQGTSITIQALDEKLDPTGKNYSTKTTDDAGLFAIGSQIESRYVEIIATGYYFNEIEGKVSSSTLTLRSLSDLSEEGKTNVNLLTTLESDRMMALVKGGKSVAEARKQAEQEIFAVFNIPNTVGDTGFDKMDITGGTDADAILLAISASLQAGRTVGELSELISKIAGEVATAGKLETDRIRTQILDGCKKVDADKVRNNLTKRYTDLGKTGFVIPPFEDYLDVNGNGVIDKKDSWIILGKNDFVVSDKGGTFELELQHNVDYEVSVGDCSWLSWQETKAYLQDARIVFTAQPSEETDARYAVITIKDKATSHAETATVTQKQKDALTVSASTFELEKEGGTFDITIGYNAEVSVNYDDAPWLSIIETKAMQSKTLTFRAQASPEVGTRVGHIVVSLGEGGGTTDPSTGGGSGSQDGGFTQSSAWSVIGTIGGDSWTRDIAMSSNGTWHATFGVNITASDEFKFRFNRDWGTNFGAASGLITTEPVGEEFSLWQGGANIKVPAGTYDLYLNPGSAVAIILPAGSAFSRAAMRASNGGLSETITVYQKGGRTLVLSDKEFTVGPYGGTVSVQATTNVDYEVTGPGVPWITLAEGAGTKAIVTDNYTWTVLANDTGEERTATIVFKDKESDLSETVTITQLQNDIVEGEDAYTIPWEGGQFDVAVQTNADLTASIIQEGEWLSILETKALHSSTITLKAMMNPDLSPRTAYLELTSGDNKWQISITQKANAQQVTVHVATPGTLSEVISEEDLHKIINLKITGKLNEEDLELLAGGSYHAGNVINPQPWISCDWLVEELDLSEMTTTTDATGEIFQCVPTLTKVVMPLHVEKVSAKAFYLCQNLVTVDFGTNSDILILEGIVVTQHYNINHRFYYYGAFQDCISLKTVTLPDNLEEFQAGAFMNCSGLETIIFPESCNIRTIKPSREWWSNGLSGDYIYMGHFWGCTSLDTVVLPSSVRKIEQYAFQGAQFRKVVFPASVNNIETGYLFDGCSRLEEVSLPSCVTEFSEYMFRGCEALTKIETAKPITRYGHYCFDGANSACFKLEQGIKYGAYVFANMDIDSVNLPNWLTTIPAGMFAGWTNLKAIDLGGVVEIGQNAFDGCTGLTDIVFPESVERVWENAFAYCDNLNNVEIRSERVIFGISGWNSTNPDGGLGWGSSEGPGWITPTEEVQEGAVITYGSGGQSFQAVSDASVKVLIGKNVVSVTGGIGDEAIKEIVFEEGSRCEEFGIARGTGITTISLPATVKRLADGALYNTKIKSISLPDNLEYIGERAFSGCSELRKIAIPASVDTIQSYAFSGCTKLYEVTIPENSSLKYLGEGVFGGELDDFVINGSETLTIDPKAFWGQKVMTIGKNIKKINGNGNHPNPYSWSTSDLNALRPNTVNLVEGAVLEELNVGGFFASNATIHLPATMKVIGDDVFDGFTGTIYIPASAYSAFQTAWGDKDWWSRVVAE